MTELKSCPFCGEEMIKYSDEEGITEFAHPKKSCVLALFEFPFGDIEAWNRRANEKETMGI